jgi:methylated-DNA-protein-cysteine methyltransferase-like protein
MPEAELSFADRVYKVVDAIPRGRVTTYGLIARALGAPRAARMVGIALRLAPDGVDVPAHRVVNRVGFLSGGWHFGHPDIMRDWLLAEDVPFKDVNEYIVDMKDTVWDPSDEPSLDWLYRHSEDATSRLA